MPEERIQREIEDILNRLDSFLPEESVTTRVRRGSSSAVTSVLGGVLAPLALISLRQMMLTAIVLIIAGFIIDRANPVGRWVLIAGVVLFFAGFVFSFFGRSAATSERRWRGRSLDLQPPTLGDRMRAWLNAKRHQRS